MPPAVMRVLTPAAMVLCLAVSATACSGDDSEPAVSVKTLPPSTPAAPADVASDVRAGKLSGSLSAAARTKVVAEVGGVVDGWIEQAFVAGPWPRAVSGVWTPFTPEAAALAQKDAAITSGAGYGERVSAVRVTRRDLRVDLLARRGTAHGATVRVAMVLEVTPLETPGENRKVWLKGRLLLTPTDAGWKIFGHDLARGGF